MTVGRDFNRRIKDTIRTVDDAARQVRAATQQLRVATDELLAIHRQLRACVVTTAAVLTVFLGAVTIKLVSEL